MRIATILDTQTASTNLGDQIIMEAVRREVAPLLSDAFVYSVASHEWMGRKSRSLLSSSDLVLAGGTNLLSSRMWFRPLWKLSPFDAFRRYEVTLMGVGWYQHQKKPDAYTRGLLRRVLSKERLHSVRDSYSLNMLASIGIENTVNTGCPTLWCLTPSHCARVPRERGAEVVTTLNTYIPNPKLDQRLLKTLEAHYERVHFWIQTETDYDYARQLGVRLTFLEPSLAALDELLSRDAHIDYVGNRLHAGIRALQAGRRTTIVEIDNRAHEMGRDFGLPTVPRDDFAQLAAMIEGRLELPLKLPWADIESWKSEIVQAQELS